MSATRSFARALQIGALATLLGASPARSEGSMLILDRLDRPAVPAPHRVDIPPAPTPPPGAPAEHTDAPAFTLRDVVVDGAVTLPRARLEAAYRPFIGRRVTARDVYAISEAIAFQYSKAGYALYVVLVPEQRFTDGTARVRVIEGHVRQVVFAGDSPGIALRLIQAYAEKIKQDRPLMRRTLERYLLLAGQASGLAVGSKLTAAAGAPGAADLTLTFSRRRLEASGALNNHGTDLLGRLQFEFNVAVNGLLQGGDRTQFTYGFPATPSRYRYAGVEHGFPIGTEGTRATVRAATLKTRPAAPNPDGTATVFGVSLAHPFRLGTRQTLYGFLSFDALDSRSALFGTVIANENIRALRLGAQWTFMRGDTIRDSLALTLSKGLGVLDADQSSPLFGDPAFTKLNLRLDHAEVFFKRAVLTVKGSAQFGFSPLPSSEQFYVGGEEFGRGFDSATFFGDRGAAGSLELSYRVKAPRLEAVSGHLAPFGYVDAAWLGHASPTVFPGHQQASSAGGGMRLSIARRGTVELFGARPVHAPDWLVDDRSWRVLFSAKSTL